ncbi:tail fiber protein [Salinarimonas sp.]|uniref:phage tail protein n=1 Tax=Salinarimonas sp. TaxID=2766526 RepID=UPI0032D982E2
METYMGTVLIWAPNFAPRSFAYCAGQLISISQFTALFSLLGTNYGGDGRTSFGLPDLRSRVPMGAGMGPGNGLTFYPLGIMAGVEHVTLNELEMPVHNHGATGEIVAHDTAGTTAVPTGGYSLASGVADVRGQAGTASIYAPPAGAPVTFAQGTVSVQVGNNGGNQSHENRMPFQGLSYIICMEGIFPPRS